MSFNCCCGCKPCICGFGYDANSGDNVDLDRLVISLPFDITVWPSGRRSAPGKVVDTGVCILGQVPPTGINNTCASGYGLNFTTFYAGDYYDYTVICQSGVHITSTNPFNLPRNSGDPLTLLPNESSTESYSVNNCYGNYSNLTDAKMGWSFTPTPPSSYTNLPLGSFPTFNFCSLDSCVDNSGAPTCIPIPYCPTIINIISGGILPNIQADQPLLPPNYYNKECPKTTCDYAGYSAYLFATGVNLNSYFLTPNLIFNSGLDRFVVNIPCTSGNPDGTSESVYFDVPDYTLYFLEDVEINGLPPQLVQSAYYYKCTQQQINLCQQNTINLGSPQYIEGPLSSCSCPTPCSCSGLENGIPAPYPLGNLNVNLNLNIPLNSLCDDSSLGSIPLQVNVSMPYAPGQNTCPYYSVTQQNLNVPIFCYAFEGGPCYCITNVSLSCNVSYTEVPFNIGICASVTTCPPSCGFNLSVFFASGCFACTCPGIVNPPSSYKGPFGYSGPCPIVVSGQPLVCYGNFYNPMFNDSIQSGDDAISDLCNGEEVIMGSLYYNDEVVGSFDIG